MWGMKNVKMVIFGSSIMEGRIGAESPEMRYYMQFQRLLTNHFPETCFSLINGSIGGESTRELMEKFDSLVLKHNPDYCLFMPGANNNDVSQPSRMLRDGELENLMEEFERRLPSSCQRIGVVFSPVIDKYHSTYDDPTWAEYLQAHGGMNNSIQPERIASRLFFEKYGYPYLDLYELIQADPEKYLLHEDGVHLSPAGHRLFAEKLYELLIPVIIKNKHDKLN